MNKIFRSLQETLSYEIERKMVDARIWNMVLKAYNRVEEDERDGIDYIFNLKEQEDLNCVVRGGLNAADIHKLYESSKQTGTSFFFCGYNHSSPQNCLTFAQVDIQLKANLNSIVKFMLAYPFIEEYKTLYVEFVTDFII